MATTKNPQPGLRSKPSIRQKLRALFKRRNTSKLGAITPSPTRSSTEIDSAANIAPNLARKRHSKQEKDLKAERRRSSRNDLSIANEFSTGGLMGLNFEEGGLEDLKMSFEKGDDAYTFGTPKASVKSPLSMEMPLLEDEENEDPRYRSDSAQPQDRVPELLPKVKKYEVKMEHSLRPVSRASANPAAEKISKEIETINKNKITRQPLSEAHSVNASKRNSLESKRTSIDAAQRQSIDTTRIDSSNKRHSLGTASTRSELNKPEQSRPLSMVQVRGGPAKAVAVAESAGIDTPIANRFSMSHVETRGGPEKALAVTESAGIDTPIANRFSMSHLQVRGGPEKALAVEGSAGAESSVPKRHSMSHVQVRGGPQKAVAVMESAGMDPSASTRKSISDVSIRGGPEKQNAVLNSVAHSRQGSIVTEPQPDPLKMHPPEVRGGPQKQSAVLESANFGNQRSSTNDSTIEQSIQVRGGPQKTTAVMESARHARNTSTSSRTSNRYSVGDVESLMNSYEQTSNASKRMSHPPLTTRRSFSEGSQPSTEQPAPSNSTALGRKPSGRKTAERLAWIRELEEGNKAGGNHGRDYMFNKLQGGVKDKLAKFENQQLTGGLARTNSNVSRRQSTSSDAYSIEQGSLKRLSRTTTIDDEFRKKLEGTVAEQQKKRIVPQEVLDLVALTDGDHETALNELMQYWNQEELIKQINDAADHAVQGPETQKVTDTVQANGKPSEPSSSGTAKSISAPAVATGLKKPIVETPTPLPLSQTKAEKLPELRRTITPEAPKISSWNPKPNLKSDPMRAANGATILSMPEGTSKWNPKPNPTPSSAQTAKVGKSEPKALPKTSEAKAETKPVVSKLPVAPSSMLLGSTVPGAKWNPKPSVKADPMQKPQDAKAEAKEVPAPKAESVEEPKEVKAIAKATPTPKSPSKAPAPLALSRSNGNASKSPLNSPTKSAFTPSKSPYSSPTKSSFTAAALPQFAKA